jgi:PTH1 family peptidyl-tRNA hydrolase
VINWVLKKPSPEHRQAIQASIARCLAAAPELLSGEMEKATMLIHTSQPPRPKPPRRPDTE